MLDTMLEPVVVPLLAEAQLRRAALVEADGDDRSAEPGRRDRVVQPGGGARRLDRDVDAAPGARLIAAPAPSGASSGSIASSAPSVEREVAPRRHRVDGR